MTKGADHQRSEAARSAADPSAFARDDGLRGPLSTQLRKGAWFPRSFTLSTVVLLHDADCPEVGGEIAVCQVGKGDGEVAAHSPSSPPAVSAEEPAPSHVVADGADGVAAEDGFAGLRHRGVAGTRHRVTFEAFV